MPLDVVGDLGVRVRSAVEVAEQVGPVRLVAEEVVEPEAELLGEVADVGVPLVDQLAAVLGDLAVGEGAAQRPAASADPAGGLVDLRGVAGLLEAVRGGQAGKAGADDDDLRRRGGSRRRCQRPRAVSPTAPSSCVTKQRATRRSGLLVCDLGDCVLDRVQQRCAHASPLFSTGDAYTVADPSAGCNPLQGEEARSAACMTVSGLAGSPATGSAAL